MKHLSLGRTAVERWVIESGESSPNVLEKRRPGRPTKFNEAKQKAVRRAWTGKRGASSVARDLTAKSTPSISRQSVSRIWGSGRNPIMYTPVVKQRRLSAANKRKRMQFCLDHSPTSSMPWAFTDGKVCSLYENDNGNRSMAWQRVGDVPPPLSHKLIARFFFYAVVGKGLKSRLIFTDPSPQKGSGKATGSQNFTGASYVKLMTGLTTDLDAWRLDGHYRLIRDRATQHTSAASSKALIPLKLPILESFPPQSWDINAIERVWAQLVKKMEGHRARTPDGFRRVIMKAWDKISQTTIDKIVVGVPSRIREIVALKGEWIEDRKV